MNSKIYKANSWLFCMRYDFVVNSYDLVGDLARAMDVGIPASNSCDDSGAYLLDDVTPTQILSSRKIIEQNPWFVALRRTAFCRDSEAETFFSYWVLYGSETDEQRRRVFDNLENPKKEIFES